eukprot:CAMPEP_0172625300 /NCGR_PEP_ID=MMETSP1068-20121228/142919_1 /TAXON_ID=35684 /ORGANISM="Pseudopedinella elastica, Strain CCMP716" /LENGTH=263 /DNA_ID=CAMNT_0013434549 /DNA_START=1 /DNA_END=793 /DNA_ORIENTATION=-
MMALITGTLASAVVGGGGAKMECGGVPLCGVLTLESGNGEGYYNHKEPTVHGLWPEVGAFGDSSCSSPTESSADPTTVYPCYSDSADDTADDSHQLSFESHEWASHGMCAGVKDAEDYFSQVCALSSAPLATMTGVKSAGGGLEEMATALKASGYEVFNIDTYNSQVELSACAKPPGVWVLSPIANFSQACGGWPKTAAALAAAKRAKKVLFAIRMRIASTLRGACDAPKADTAPMCPSCPEMATETKATLMVAVALAPASRI